MGKPGGTRETKGTKGTGSVAYKAARRSVKNAIRIAREVARREALLRRWDQPLDDEELDAFQAFAKSSPPRKSIRRGGRKKSKRRTKRRKSRAKRRTRRR